VAAGSRKYLPPPREFAAYNRATFYGGGTAGYTDYPGYDELATA
jgi:hypothetical protein